MASIKKRGNKLYIRYKILGSIKDKATGLEDTAKNREYILKNIIPKLKERIDNGDYTKKNKVKDYALKYLKKKEDLKTYLEYEKRVTNHILNIFGDRAIDSIVLSEIDDWVDSLNVSAKTKKAYIGDFRGIYHYAIRDNAVNENLLDLVEKQKHDKSDINPFSYDDISKVLSETKDDLNSFFGIAFFTGMRTGEIVGLKWEDIDFERKEIHISRSIRMGVESTPKTINSIRTIDLLDSLVPYLKKQFYRTGDKESYVFLTQNDTHIFDVKNIRDYDWAKLLKKLDISYRPIYHMRHSFATMMIENGEDILWVSHMLGHVSSKTTLDRYAKFTSRKNKQRATFLQSFF